MRATTTTRSTRVAVAVTKAETADMVGSKVVMVDMAGSKVVMVDMAGRMAAARTRATDARSVMGTRSVDPFAATSHIGYEAWCK